VVCVDARPENIARLHSLYPGREAHVANVEVDRLSELGRFDIVFCYGLLYHVENPIAALRNIAGWLCGDSAAGNSGHRLSPPCFPNWRMSRRLPRTRRFPVLDAGRVRPLWRWRSAG